MIGFAVRRLRGRLPLAAAALLTMLITTAALTTLAAFDRGVDDAGLRSTLQGPGRVRATVLLSGDRSAASRAGDDAEVRDVAARLFGPLPATVDAVARSRSYGLPGAATTGTGPDLTLLAALDRGRLALTAGQWPAAARAGSPVEVAVPSAALARLGLAEAALPADLTLTDRNAGGTLTVRVTGVYRAADRTGPYWRLDPLGGREVQVKGFTTYGPLLVDDSAFTAGGLAQAGRSWLIGADFGAVDTEEARRLAERAAPLTAPGYVTPAGLTARTDLPGLLAETRSAALVARSTLMIGALQLAVLAAAAVLLVVHLLAERRTAEDTLLTARGAARGRLAALAAVEALLLALPSALLAPLLTPVLLRLLAVPGVSAGPAWSSWPVAAGCALGCALLATLPAVFRGAGAAVLRRTGRRQQLVAGAARSGADLALVLLAVLAYRQLDRYRGGLSTDTAGDLGVDPLLVAAPTLALCAGTVVVLRLLPFAARLGGRLAARGRGLGSALAGWQLARRPARSTGPVLLLVLAVAMSVLALGQHAAWSTSQRDQAAFTTAGGLRITSPGVPALGQGGRYGSLPGGDRLTPVAREEQPLPGGRSAQLLAADARGLADRLRIRPDLLEGRSPAEVLTPIAVPAPTGPQAGLVLPGRPTRIDLDVSLEVLRRETAPPPDLPYRYEARPEQRPALRVLLRDRFGIPYWLMMPGLPEQGDARLSLDLAPFTGAPVGSPAYPLTVAALEFSYRENRDGGGAGRLTVHRVATSDGPGGPATPVPVPAGLGWAAAGPDSPGDPAAATGSAPAGGDRLAVLDYQARLGAERTVRVLLEPTDGKAAAAAPTEIPVVATRAYLDALGARPGDLVRMPVGTTTVPLRITTAVRALPTTDGAAVLADLGTLERLLARTGTDGLRPAEWWLPATGPGDPVVDRAVRDLRAATGSQNLAVLDETAAALLDDPQGAAPQQALAALAVAAAVLAAIGFAAATAASGTERAGEFAVLSALGMPRRGVARTVLGEQAVLVGLGTAVGLGLGALLVHLVVPLVVLTPAARRPVPEVLVHLPLGTALAAALATAAVPLLAAALGVRRHRDPAARLRHVEEM
ncbi:ABC transporter permease [Kitasatospora camelliae]|uniref:ABC transporter permease n=1 Tax=Kitasatospora camelliae TaxID=3156397 RepID=A0AAU8JVT0_9ACTN